MAPPRGRPVEFPIKKLVALNQELVDAIEAFRDEQQEDINQSEAIRLLIGRGLSLGELFVPTESIVHLGTELVRGIELSNVQSLEFLDAVTKLYEVVDEADDELEEVLERVKAEMLVKQ